MSNPKNKVILKCPEGPCTGGEKKLTTDVVFDIRERGASATNPVDPESLEISLTPLGEGEVQLPASIVQGDHGRVVATFTAVPQGWFRALVARRVNGKIESSAARRVQVVKLKGGPKPNPQVVILTMAKQGVARFLFVTELESSPLANANVIIRHPDGSDKRHTTDGTGELRLPGATGDVFSVVRIEHPTENGIIATEHQEST